MADKRGGMQCEQTIRDRQSITINHRVHIKFKCRLKTFKNQPANNLTFSTYRFNVQEFTFKTPMLSVAVHEYVLNKAIETHITFSTKTHDIHIFINIIIIHC